MAERLRQRLAAPFTVKNQEVVLSVSIGIVVSGSITSHSGDVLRDAEIAMYRAKHAGKARCEVFDSAMQSDAVKRLQLETDLRKALERDEFRVHYQPLVSLRNGQIVGFEALTRWQRPQGIVMPGEFIKVADEIGITLPINRQLLRESCEQVRKWQAMFPSPKSPLTISANVTARQFAHPDLAAEIGQILRQTGIDPRCVDLEITENIAMADAEHSARVLSQLKALGVRLSIDDFGTGYSSLSRLQQFPVDILKIDRSFVSGMDRDDETREIVRIIVMLAQSLGMKVVAEGIEQQEQLAVLRQFGCELGQGYLFSKPADAASTEQFLRTSHSPAPRTRAKSAASRS
jgi:EAL domain-containing protein (putative c-di-GMP-specific phosphodiesterase class I)